MNPFDAIQLSGLGLALLVLVWVANRVRRAEALDLCPVVDRLQTIKADVDRLDRIVREDGEQARQGADERGRLLRDEVSKALMDTRTELGQAMTGVRGEVVVALTSASQDLRESSDSFAREQKERLGEMATKIHVMTESIDARMEGNRTTIEAKLGELRIESVDTATKLREEVQGTLRLMGEGLGQQARETSGQQRLVLELVVAKIDRSSATNAEAAEKLRESVQSNLTVLRNENSEKLEQMRKTVDEQLQGTLEKRFGESFKLVSERLEQVHKGLGEMQALATGVGDLKSVLTNVKVRGTWGETQLSNLLAQVFSPEQYYKNWVTRPGSSERVEFAVRLPGQGPCDQEVLLPIDAKFPREDYERLVEAAERGDPEAVEAAAKALEVSIKAAAREIGDKYINPPHTTDFAILFLPTEGLYAEVLRRPGLAEQIQHDFRVALAGPTTLNALLNALQTGFRTLAIQKRSSEVWEILGAVKTEFGKYAAILEKVQKKLHEASKTVDDVTVRHRAVTRSLRLVTEMPGVDAQSFLGAPAIVEADHVPTAPELEGDPAV